MKTGYCVFIEEEILEEVVREINFVLTNHKTAFNYPRLRAIKDGLTQLRGYENERQRMQAVKLPSEPGVSQGSQTGTVARDIPTKEEGLEEFTPQQEGPKPPSNPGE